MTPPSYFLLSPLFALLQILLRTWRLCFCYSGKYFFGNLLTIV